jgi:hypothetical protein
MSYEEGLSKVLSSMKQPTRAIDELLGLMPQRRRVGFEPMEQASACVEGRSPWSLRLHPCPSVADTTRGVASKKLL